MRISKKLVIFVVGFCLPAMIAITFSLNLWFDNRVEQLKHASIDGEFDNIASLIDTELERLALFTQIYGVPISALDRPNRQRFEQAWLNSGLAEHRSLFYLDQDKDKATAFASSGGTINHFDSGKLPASLFALTQAKTGFYLQGDKGFIISVAPVDPSLSIVFVRGVDVSLLNRYQVNDALSHLQLGRGKATSLIPNYAALSHQLNVPSLLDDEALHLSITLSDSVFNDIHQPPTQLLYGVIGLSGLLLFLGFLWLRVGLVSPFRQLLTELASIDPEAKTYEPIRGEGCEELAGIAEQVNHLMARIFQQKERSKTTLEAIAEAVILTDVSAKVIYLNPQAERLLQCESNTAVGESIERLFKFDKQINQTLFTLMRSGVSQPLLSKVKCCNDNSKIMERSINNLRDPHNQVIGSVIVLRDITQEELLKHQLRRKANFDSITSLLNRSAFEERVVSFAADAKILAMCYFDLEQFKLINDSCGHSQGDVMLNRVAKAIQSSLTGNVLVARLGGDEFGLALKDNTLLQVAQQVKRIMDNVVKLVMEHQGCQYRVGMSAGVAVARSPYILPLELLKDADIACIAAKRKGSNQVHFYDNKDKELTYQRNAPKWAVRIAQAIERNELILYYQSIKGISGNGQHKRMEILLRIQEPCGRILPPAQFIEAAERFKLMTEVDKEVIRKTFLWLSSHPELWPDHSLSINLSGNSLGAEGMVDYIIAQLHHFAIPSSCICFEITETSAIQNRDRAMEMLNRLRKQGFAFALDDFGTGFASYGYLRELPVNYVKIDGCFIKTLATNAKDYAIVKSIHDVCCVMGIETVAEFVENEEIIERLESIGINYAQGYAIGRPQSLETYLDSHPQLQLIQEAAAQGR
ncbi:EAL domain-containing protein [Shewanella algidipiscicola]|uniref:sensor domain-containing protein n=1 Tax=Shewanella algidipiscicola TaxID=614070 RepID=UPI000D783F26|nr:EAL domain-containing protein [Shewanella algidipiscicola]